MYLTLFIAEYRILLSINILFVIKNTLSVNLFIDYEYLISTKLSNFYKLYIYGLNSDYKIKSVIFLIKLILLSLMLNYFGVYILLINKFPLKIIEKIKHM